jgi:AcrR family transcriptional regulator
MPQTDLSSDMPGVVRLRDQQEALTRHLILNSARRLFASQGYAGTPVRMLAKEAGVSPQTIYDTYGSKAGVLAGLPDLLDEEAGVADLFEQRHQTSEPVELVGLLARISRRIRERCGDIVTILRSGAAVEPDIAATAAEGFRRRRLGVEAVMKRIRQEGGLAKGLTVTRGADIATALMTDDVCDRLVNDAGWTYDAYERWLKETLSTLLLRS